MRGGLGDWIRRKLKSGVVAMTTESQKTLNRCGASEAELREQWALQVEAQISLRAHAPKRLQKEVDAVFAIQEDVSAVEKVIDTARTTLAQGEGGATAGTKASLQELRNRHQQLLAGVEKLYTSLNIHDKFPELKGVDIDFVRTLLLARDLKINIRKRAVGSFLEWERLDQAVGGKHQALGTKAHQRTRQAITKRKPALLRAIHTFNKYCAQLTDLHNPSWGIPLPQPLPINLAALRDRSDLMEDVWISRREEEMPRWLADSDIRDGIRALLKKDGCLWERRRLGNEADNLCRWLGTELSAVELAIRMKNHSPLHVLLAEHRRQLLFLQKRWSTPLASNVRFESAVREATRTAQVLSGEDPELVLDWIVPPFVPTVVTVEDDIDDDLGHGEADAPAAESPASTLVLDSDNLIAEDELEGGDDTLLDDEHTIEIASAIISWTLPENLKIYYTPNYQLTTEQLVPVPRPHDFKRRTLVPLPARRFNVMFETEMFRRFLSPTAMLDDESVNGAAILLQTHYLRFEFAAAASTAILTTHDLVRGRFNAADDQLWRNAKNSQYWSKNVWLLPIHRPDAHHWVLCIVYPDEKKIHLFDSFAEQKPWHAEVKIIMNLVARLSCIARKNGHPCAQYDFEGWTARPVLIKSAQTNGYDCGLWILAVMDAVLMGYDTTSCKESDMTIFRRCILNLLLQLAEN
ncbi:hypothetical protein HWV62_34409 [Athelia sp. TMB]|nr:hypothetical protein HWV62_34409 [Athelia sp. TMB]